jgi:hypothetical protein
MKEAFIQQPLLSKGSANKHVSTAKISLQQMNSILYFVRAQILLKAVRLGPEIKCAGESQQQF